MTKKVDDRIVEMQFNNKQFESGVQTSIKTVEKLKQGLNLDESAKSLANLDAVGKRFSLAGMSSGIEALSNKFSSLGIIGITVLQNITNAVLNTGKNILSALTIDPIKTGLQEYETKIGAIQTILTNTKSKGTTLTDVNVALAELNEYADKTIYNFAEMTKNIGTFTAAGIALAPATAAIKGIANLAAGSGSSADQASSAMYQLSQAMASGSVKLMDWNSVVNAGMGGELFQNALKATAKQMGIVVDAGKPFRETLESGWVTTEVLTKTLAKFAADEDLIKAATQVTTFTKLFDTMKESVQSGWAVSWENIIGDKDQATKMLTDINNAFGALIGPSAEARNEMLKFWNANGGRDALIEGLVNVFHALMAVLKPIGEAFREVFPAMTGERLVALTKGFRDFTENLKIGDETAGHIKDTFKALFSILELTIKIISTAIKVVMNLGGALLPLVTSILKIGGSLGNYVTSLSESIQSTGAFNSVLEKLHNILIPMPDMFSVFNKIATIFSNLATTIGGAFDVIQKKVSGVLKTLNFNNMFIVLDAGLFATILLGIKKFIKSLTEITSNAGSFLGNITGILDDVRGCFEAYQTNLKANVLLKIAMAIGILAASILVLSTIDPEKLGSALTAMATMFGELIVTMGIFEKIVVGPGFRSMLVMVPMLLALSTAIFILSVAMTKLAKLDWNGIIKGLAGIGILMAELALFMKMTTFSSMAVKTSISILVLAVALNVLASAIKKMGDIDTGVMIKGLSGMAVALTEIGLFLNLVDPKRAVSTAISVAVLGTAMLILANALIKMGGMSWEELGKSLVAMGGALLIMALTLNAMPKMSLINSLAILDIATSLILMGEALKELAEMSWDAIIKSLTTMGIAFGIIAGMLMAMRGHFVDATALTIVSVALLAFAFALKTLGSMSLVEIGIGLLALAGIFTVLGVTALVLGPLVPVILALGIAFAVFGVAIAAIGGGVLALSAGLAALAISGVAGATALVAIISSLVSLLPFMLQKFGEGIIAMATVIGDNAPTVVEAIMKLLLALLDTVMVNLPKIIEKGVAIVVALINGITKSLPKVIQAAFNLIITFVNGLADAIRNNTDRMIAAAGNLMSAMMEGCEKVLAAAVPDFVTAGTNIVRGFIDGIKNKIKDAAWWAANLAYSAIRSAKDALGIDSPSKAFSALGMYSAIGMANGLNAYSDRAVNASEGMGTSVVGSLQKAVSKISDVFNSDLDGSPTIRPVLDLTDINKGLNSAFDKSQVINVDSVRSKTAAISIGSGSKTSLDTSVSKTTEKSAPENQNGGLSVIIQKFVNNRTQDVQAFAEELEFYRQQIVIARGGN